MKLKIGILTNMPTPYRTKMWESYAEIKDINMDIYYCTDKEEDRYWNIIKNEKVSEYFLPGFTIKNSYHFNISILKYFKNYDAWFIGGYNMFTSQLLILLCKIFDIPYILLIDGINPQKLDKNNVLDFLKKYYIKGQFATLANGIIGKKFVKKFDFSEENVFDQKLTVDVDKFKNKSKNKRIYKREIKNKYNIRDDEIVLLYVGRIIKQKGVQDLIEATKHFRNKQIPVKILIVGEGEYKTFLEKEKDDNIIFCGVVDNEKLHKYYYSADLFILPTYSDVWGLVINEAMSCALPIITTNEAGASLELIKDNGEIYNAGNISELVMCIEKLMGIKNHKSNYNISSYDLKKNLSEIGKRSLEIIENYKYKDSKREFNKIISKIKDLKNYK
jgi:glycosyltransferase involved in cell wall biosynthesis